MMFPDILMYLGFEITPSRMPRWSGVASCDLYYMADAWEIQASVITYLDNSISMSVAIEDGNTIENLGTWWVPDTAAEELPGMLRRRLSEKTLDLV